MSYKRLRFPYYYGYGVSHSSREKNIEQDFYDSAIVYNDIKFMDGDFEKDANYFAFYDTSRDCIMIYFQGSSGTMDWASNVDFPASDYQILTVDGVSYNVKAADGWKDMYLGMKANVNADYETLKGRHPTAELEIIGHSLGSGMAQLCALDMYNTYGVNPYLYTTGSVKAFCADDVENCQKAIKSICKCAYNFYDVNDAVGYMPPTSSAYFHVNPIVVAKDKENWWKKATGFNTYHFVYDIESLYTAVGVYEDGIPTFADGEEFVSFRTSNMELV